LPTLGSVVERAPKEDVEEGVAVPFVPSDFDPPETLEGDGFMIRPLLVTDAVIDYDAVMTSIATIRDSYWRAPGWPADDLTLAQNLIDLAWHTKERQFKTSFAYIPVSPDGLVELGCIYIDPSIKLGYDANVQFWVRASESETGLDERLFSTIREWIAGDWPFERVAYPGREITREEWDEIPATPWAEYHA
jgi:hypothetical protein